MRTLTTVSKAGIPEVCPLSEPGYHLFGDQPSDSAGHPHQDDHHWSMCLSG